MIAEVAQHDAELDRRVEVEAVLVVEIDGIEGWDRGLQRLEVLIKDAARAGALCLDQRGDVLPVSKIRGADAQGHSFDRALFQKRHVAGKIRMRLGSDIGAVRCQRKLAIQIQVANAVDLNAPDDGLGKPRAFDFLDVRRSVFVERPAAENPAEPRLRRSGSR